MIPFDYHRATSVADAITAVADRPDAVYLAGGTNLVDHMKLGIVEPGLLVDVGHLPLTDIEQLSDGTLRVGRRRPEHRPGRPPCRAQPLPDARPRTAVWRVRAATQPRHHRRQPPAAHPLRVLPGRHHALQQAHPGSGCSAIGGYVRYHAILGASEHCVAVHPSDMAVAMSALDAHVVFHDADGEHRLPVTEFHRLPGDRPDRDTELPPGALITAVEIPPPPDGARSTYRKVRDRASYAFALTSVAAELAVDDGTVTSARIALGGVAHKPWRARRAEQVLAGAAATEDTFRRAADAELEQAQPLPGNEFKVELTRRTIVATLTTLAEGRQR